ARDPQQAEALAGEAIEHALQPARTDRRGAEAALPRGGGGAFADGVDGRIAERFRRRSPEAEGTGAADEESIEPPLGHGPWYRHDLEQRMARDREAEIARHARRGAATGLGPDRDDGAHRHAPEKWTATPGVARASRFPASLRGPSASSAL